MTSLLDLEKLSPEDVDLLAQQLREIGAGASSRQTVYERVVELFYDTFQIPDSGQPACVLARGFQTCHYARLPVEYQQAANVLLEQIPSHPHMRCLALMATRGTRNVWNDVATSTRHQCIPLPSVEFVQRAPMIARLLEQFEVSVERLVDKSPLDPRQAAAAREAPRFNAFHISAAKGSPFLPAQAEFVEAFGVQSVLGLGGLLQDGDIFAVILFTRVPVPETVAALFRNLGPSVREAMLPFPERQTFARVLD